MSVMEDLLESDWGQQLLSDYHIVKCIHVSPMSEIMALESADGRQRLILKAMNPAVTSLKLLEALKSLRVEGIVPILDYFTTEKFVYVVKPYVDGVTLLDHRFSAMSLNDSVGIIKQLTKLVMHCHSQDPPIILRDIKPDNLIVIDSKLYLLDLESSKLKTSQKIQRDTVLLGTPGYAAPEQYGFQTSDERTDIYAIGQVLLFLLERLSTKPLLQRPYLWYVFRLARHATAFDPQRRINSTHQLLQQLEGIGRRRVYWLSGAALLMLAFAALSIGQGTGLSIALEPESQPLGALQNDTSKAEQRRPVMTTAAVQVEPITEAETVVQTEIETAVVTDVTMKPQNTQAAKPESTQAAKPQNLTEAKTPPGTGVPVTTSKESTNLVEGTVIQEVEFSGTVVYSGEVTRAQFLIYMEGLTDTFYRNQFGSPVTFSEGSGAYKDNNKASVIVGHRYRLTGYLDLNRNFQLDADEPKQVITTYRFDGSARQSVDFTVLSTAKATTTTSEEKSWMPGVYHRHQPEIKSFKTYVYRSQMDTVLKDFDAFTVLGTNTSPSQATAMVARMVTEGSLGGLANASLKRDYIEFNSVDSYVDNHMVIFVKEDVLLGYVYIVDGQALPYVIYKP